MFRLEWRVLGRIKEVGSARLLLPLTLPTAWLRKLEVSVNLRFPAFGVFNSLSRWSSLAQLVSWKRDEASRYDGPDERRSLKVRCKILEQTF